MYKCKLVEFVNYSKEIIFGFFGCELKYTNSPIPRTSFCFLSAETIKCHLQINLSPGTLLEYAVILRSVITIK